MPWKVLTNSLIFEERKLLNSCQLIGHKLASQANSVFTWNPHSALWTEIPSAPEYQLEPELESILLHSILLLVPLLPSRNTHIFRIIVSLLIFYHLETQNVS